MNNRLYGNLIFELSHEGRRAYSLPENKFAGYEVPAGLRRKDDAMLPECDEMTVVRHYTNHSENNFGVNNGFYPLGSCTMKYNPAINEEVAAMPEFANLHPLQPADTCQGALEAYDGLQRALSEISGLAKFTLNPFAGAHGELTGLMVIRSYHERRGDTKRTKVIVPDSAHGTNPASAEPPLTSGACFSSSKIVPGRNLFTPDSRRERAYAVQYFALEDISEPVSKRGEPIMLCHEADPMSVSEPVFVILTAVYKTGWPGRIRSIFSSL